MTCGAKGQKFEEDSGLFPGGASADHLGTNLGILALCFLHSTTDHVVPRVPPYNDKLIGDSSIS